MGDGKRIRIFSGKFLYVWFFVLGIIFSFCLVCFSMSNDKVKEVSTSDYNLNDGISNVYDSVVYIENYKNSKLRNSGTGFVYKKNDGRAFILTNYHVVEGNTSLKVTLSDDSKSTAKYLGGDKYLDIACISIDDKYVKRVAKLVSSSNSVLGDTLFTVGSPLGDNYRGTVTRGILSGKDRMVVVSNDYVMKVLQTDAAMNPGNSGGPLCNSRGEVIGINSMKLVKDEIEGMAFAISVDDVINHLNDFEKGKLITRPYLGISIFNLSDREYFSNRKVVKNLKTKLDNGVVVLEVENNSPSFGKFSAGDIIVKVDGVSVSEVAYFRYELFKHSIGDKVKITVERNGKLKDIYLVLTKKVDEKE
ncbi:MAG: trypsin-like peptidase domain-containing protein [bacterium]|nr:trypsin-like peptidase domain-containing protein [bacterium]